MKYLKYIGLFVGIILFGYWQNNQIVVNNVEVIDQNIPSAFKHYRIIQISDLHSKMFGKNQKKLVEIIEENQPDIIVITGDYIDSAKANYLKAPKILAEKLVDVAPVYYVSGNHEAYSLEANKYSEMLEEIGVVDLNNKKIMLKKSNDEIELLGLADPEFNTSFNDDTSYAKRQLGLLKEKQASNNFTILLSHRPELFNVYQDYQINLSLTGHAHGGQIRLPLIGGIIAPNQGILPKYDSGIYQENNSQMIVSRGLGNSIIPQRIFNRPELVVITLR